MPRKTLRVAGGTARGVPLAMPRGVRLRPTSAQVREAIFNVLGGRVEGARVLDAYAGTGALGIEALSRGAAHATLVEADGRAVAAIIENLSRAAVQERARVLRGRMPRALDSLEGPVDIAFMDPPYEDNEADEALLAVARVLAPTGLVVYEYASRYNPPERPSGLRLVDRRVYGDTGVAFYEPEEGS